ncbi:GNAT family N-acetyltransferase [Pseudonocardia cypriaca]|uniref:Acetyltransferase (GNAT) family protein n=1 Tax=Pseudonocardia cypriaca TaxID=882449 RepID=A0A543FP14_9PSEU|nr:GNAT family N-acetyltransferase [Pseudonocardia cypriaca]TQM35464.1 acetyltransferase (GNAT) family protein [Pseudonocardia cypriaca]
MDVEAVVAPVTAAGWADLEAVFGMRGDPARCWCQWFYAGAEVGGGAVGERNREALRTQVRQGPAPGVLAHRDGEPVGWCAVAPRPTYTRLQRSEVLRGTPAAELADPTVWSVTCFVVRVGHRRGGLSRVLLDGAVRLAREGGARVVEGYPVDVTAKARTSSAELYHGPLSTFLAAGFREVARPRPARPVVRLEPTP